MLRAYDFELWVWGLEFLFKARAAPKVAETGPQARKTVEKAIPVNEKGFVPNTLAFFTFIQGARWL